MKLDESAQYRLALQLEASFANEVGAKVAHSQALWHTGLRVVQ